MAETTYEKMRSFIICTLDAADEPELFSAFFYNWEGEEPFNRALAKRVLSELVKEGDVVTIQIGTATGVRYMLHYLELMIKPHGGNTYVSAN